MSKAAAIEKNFAWNDIDGKFNDPNETVPTEEIFNELVSRQWEEYGSVNAPCVEAQELIDQWSIDLGDDCLPQWRAAVARYKPGMSPVESSGPQYLNDAEILGADHAKLAEFLEQPMVFMIGELFPADNRRSTRDGDWKRAEMPLFGWINGGDGWGLSKHPEGRTKDGASIVPSENIDGARKDSAVKTMYAIGIDIDSGTSLEHVLDRLEDEGIFAVVYTTYNHRKTEFELKHDDVMRKMKLEETPNRAQVQEYLQLHHATRFDRDFISKIEIVEARKQTKDGMRIVLRTPPIDKFRVIIPLAEPVELADLAPTLAQWKDIWADKVAGVCRNMLDAHFDVASCDVNRLFYTPRHPKGDDNWYSAIVMGRPLTFDEIEPYSKAKYVRERSLTGDPFLAGGDGSERQQYQMPDSGRPLSKWHTAHKHRFLAADLMEAHAADKVRNVGGERDGTVHIECPFEHEHSKSGGSGTMVMNPHANEHEVWSVFCHHDACKGRHKLEFLQQMLADEWFDESVLEDEEFILDDDSVVEEITLTAKAIERRVAVAEIDLDSSALEIRAFLEDLMKEGADVTTLNRAKTEITKNAALGVRELNKIIKGIEAEMRASSCASQDNSIPIVNHWDFSDMVEHAESGLLKATDAGQPVVYQYEGDIALFENGQRSMATKFQFGAVLNDETTWHHQTTTADQVLTRGVSAPDDVVQQVFNRRKKSFPVLAEVKKSPFFARDGALVSEHGYDAKTETFLDLGGLTVPTVSNEPSNNDLEKAKRLIIEETLSDFPFDGVTDRDERLVRALSNEGDPLPSMAHAVAMILERPARDLIEGVTPCYTLTKPLPGTGGGRLVEVSSLIATGEEMSAQTMPASDEEFTKVMSAVVNDSAEFCWFDNMNTETDSGVFASALTAPKVKARLLGTSNMVDAAVRHTWVAVANNFKGSSEIIRRLVCIELNARVSAPTKRTGFRHPDLKGWVRQNRGELVWACLTLIQNWVAKGMKPWEGEPKASFEEWSRVMGGILRDAGIRGFLENEEQFKGYAASSGGDDAVQLFVEHLAREYDSGIALRAGGTSPIRDRKGTVVSVQAELNCADDGKALLIDGWGYNREDAQYNHARGIKDKFRDAARGTYAVTITEKVEGKIIDVKYDVSFEEKTDPKSPNLFYWVMEKRQEAA